MRKFEYLQNIWKESTCFGCGPSNPDGLQLKSRWADDGRSVIADYHADEKFNSGMPDVMYGGTVASLIDCHSIWAAMAFAYKAEHRDMGSDPVLLYVTGQLAVNYRRPTPLSRPVRLRAWVEGDIGRKINVRCELGTDSDITAFGDVIAVQLV